MFDYIKILVHLSTVLMIGFIVFKLIYHNSLINLRNFSLLYGLGSGFITLEIFFLSLVGCKFSLAIILLPWGILSLFIIFKKKDRIKIDFNLKGIFVLVKNYIINFNFLLTILSALIISLLLLEIIMGMPLIGWDAWAHWGYKAKIFYLEKRIPLEFYNDKFSIIPIKEYPLLVNLIEVFFYNFLGRFDDSQVKIIFIFFYVCFLIYFYTLLKDIYNKNKASLFTFFLATIPMFAEYAFGYFIGYADLVFTYFNFISVTSLWLWSLQKKKELFYISSIFAGFALWTKIEGIVLLMTNLMCLFFLWIYDKKNNVITVKLFLKYLLIPFTINIFWYFLVFFLHFSSIHITAKSFVAPWILSFQRSLVLIDRFWIEFLDFSKWNIFWLLFILSPIIYFGRFFNKFSRFILFNLLIQLALYFVVIIIDIDFDRAIWNSLSRLILHLTPLVFIQLLSILYWDKNRTKYSDVIR